MSPATLGFGFTQDRRVVVDDHIPAGSRVCEGGPVPHAIIYPFVMAGKLMSNFPPSQIPMVAGVGDICLEGFLYSPQRLAGKRSSELSLFGTLSSGYGWAEEPSDAKKWIRAEFMDVAGGILGCTTRMAWGREEEYRGAAVDAALDYARRLCVGQHVDVMKGAKVFFESFRDNELSNPGIAILLANVSAMPAAGIDTYDLTDETAGSFELDLEPDYDETDESLDAAKEAYEKGDYVTAIRLSRPLAEEGDALAQACLGLMYHNGQGVPQDDVEAHKWYNLAASRFPPGENRDTATKYRDDVLAKKMTPEQLADAQRRARNWKPSQ